MTSQQKLKYLTCIFSFTLLTIIILLTQNFHQHSIPETIEIEVNSTLSISLDIGGKTPEDKISFTPVQSRSCRFDNCFDITRCEFTQDSLIKVYIYPSTEFYYEQTHLQFNTSLPYKGIITAIKNSPFYTADPNRACVFIPPIDTLFHSTNHPVFSSMALSHLPFWNEGSNHLIFSLLPSRPNSLPSLSTHRALVAGPGLLYSQYRTGFDLSLPAYNFPERLSPPPPDPAATERNLFLLVILPLELDTSLQETLEGVQLGGGGRVRTLDFCYEGERCIGEETVDYPGILLRTKFCLLLTHATPDLLDAMMHGCVPVYLSGSHMLPFQEVLDWTLIGVPIRPAFLPRTLSILDSLSEGEWRHKQSHSLRVWSRYLSSLGSISLTALLVLNERVFSAQAGSYRDWNLLGRDARGENPLLMLPTPARDTGLTAVIVSHGSETLAVLVSVLASVESVRRVLVVWSNRGDPPTHVLTGTDLVQIVQSDGGRFLPLEHILGECVLSLTDDVNALTREEVELGYRTWRQFPDRLLGFSAASHLWNEADGRWEFVSGGGDEFSLLTGPLFYHSHYHTLLAEHAPDLIGSDERCEDLTLNFLVSILTDKSPVKLTQKTESEEEVSRAQVKNECLNQLVTYFGRMPLRPTRFRLEMLSPNL